MKVQSRRLSDYPSKKDTQKIEVTMEPNEESSYTPEEKATYQKIKDYVKDKYGVNVHTSYIAQVKRMCWLDMGENYNKSKKENPEVKQCPQEKMEYIKDVLRYLGLIYVLLWHYHLIVFILLEGENEKYQIIIKLEILKKLKII